MHANVTASSNGCYLPDVAAGGTAGNSTQNSGNSFRACLNNPVQQKSMQRFPVCLVFPKRAGLNADLSTKQLPAAGRAVFSIYSAPSAGKGVLQNVIASSPCEAFRNLKP